MNSAEKFKQEVTEQLNDLKRNDQLRSLHLAKSGIDFYSNDYLGFARDSSSAVFSGKNKEFSTGATGSRLISGEYEQISILEEKIARYHHAESALVFPSGFQANVGLLQAITKRGDLILFDEQIHASLRDGIRLSFADSQSFRHNDPNDLREKLLRAKGQAYIVVESLYSMDGDFGLLDIFSKLSNEFGAYLIVDEAHATGIFGELGCGLASDLSTRNACVARMYSFGKAAGCQGAAVVGSHELRELLINKHRGFIYSTGISPYLTQLISESYDKFLSSNHIRNHLFQVISDFEAVIQEINLNWKNAHGSPIKAVLVPEGTSVVNIANALVDEGFLVKGIRQPTVKRGEERIRICLHAFNSKQEIQSFTGLIQDLMK